MNSLKNVEHQGRTIVRGLRTTDAAFRIGEVVHAEVIGHHTNLGTTYVGNFEPKVDSPECSAYVASLEAAIGPLTPAQLAEARAKFNYANAGEPTVNGGGTAHFDAAAQRTRDQLRLMNVLARHTHGQALPSNDTRVKSIGEMNERNRAFWAAKNMPPRK